MDLYLILLAILALGLVALALIFFGGTKSSKNDFVSPQANFQKEEINPASARLQSRIAPALSSKNNSSKASDAALASLGFSAYDGLLVESNDVAQISVPVTPAIQQHQAIKPKQKLLGKADYIVFYIMAPKNQPFIGYELLQALLAADLRFGKMNIFHRYAEESDDSETILFSVASAVEPGIFDMANIGAVTCPGLSLFMSISATEDPQATFDLFLETAEVLAEDLGGILCNSAREPLTDEVLAECRERVSS